jgi:hypothetical protein
MVFKRRIINVFCQIFANKKMAEIINFNHQFMDEME